jgi:hypothetical protein
VCDWFGPCPCPGRGGDALVEPDMLRRRVEGSGTYAFRRVAGLEQPYMGLQMPST